MFKDTLQSVVRRTLKPHTKQLGFNRTIRDPFSRNRYSQGFLNFTNEIKGPQFKLGLKDRFGNFRSTKIRLIKQIEEQQDNDYYLNINEKSDFCRKKLPISNPVFLSDSQAKGRARKSLSRPTFVRLCEAHKQEKLSLQS